MRSSDLLLRVLLLSTTMMVLSSSGWAATSAQITTARTNGLAYLYQSQNLNGSWDTVPGVQVTATTAVIEAMLNAGISQGTTFNAAVTALVNANPTSTDGLSRQLDTLSHIGNNVSYQITQLNAGSNAYAGWGTLPGQATSIADSALASNALLDASPSYFPNGMVNLLCNDLISGQTAGGGWSYQRNPAISGTPAGVATPAILPTAYSMLVLEKTISKGLASLTCGGTGYTLSTLANNGLTYLLTKQNVDGGFGENGTSGALETALAYRAIAAVSPANAALATAQNYLVNTQQTNGSWAGDPLQTALALQTLPVTVLAATKYVGVPDAVAAVIWPNGGGNPAALVAGNGQSVAGQTASLWVASSSLNQPFSGHLPTPAGTGPFTYKLLSGALPDGITLASNGTLSGSSSVAGQFNFTYQVTDSLNNVTTLTAQFDASNAYADNDVPTLPQWAAILFGLILVGSGVRRRMS